MAYQNRLSQSYLKTLANSPDVLYKQGFEPLLRYIDANSPLHAGIGYSVSLKQDPVRLGQVPILHFHASEFSDVVQQTVSGHYKLRNVYWGMFGINGALPLHFTEYAIERNYRHKDTTLTEFCDIFHHRFLSLFYRSWAVSQPTVSHDSSGHDNRGHVNTNQDYFYNWVSSIAGDTNAQALSKVGTASKIERPTQQSQQARIPDSTAHIHTFLSGLFSQKHRSSGVLSQILSEYLQQKVTIAEFEGDWYPLPDDAKCCLGGCGISNSGLANSNQSGKGFDENNAQLGVTTIIGDRYFERGFNFSILIGPLDYPSYLALVEQPHHFEKIKQLTTRHVGSEYNFTIKLLLHKHNTRVSMLGTTKLGTNTWLSPSQHKPLTQDSDVHDASVIDDQRVNSFVAINLNSGLDKQFNNKAIVAYQHSC